MLIRFHKIRLLLVSLKVFGNAIGDHAGAIWALGAIAVGHIEFIQHAFDLSSLSHGYGKFVIVGTLPDVSAAKEPSNVAHGFYAEVCYAEVNFVCSQA